MNAVLFSWARRLRGAVFAGVFVLFWAFRPAPLFYLVLLEGTFLSALLILLFLYDFYGKPPGERSPGRLALWPVLLFYTRTFFQWYFVPVYAVALLLRRCPPGKVLRTVVISAVLIAPLLIKQHALYGTLATTTYDGYHQTGLLWYHPTDAERAAVRSTLTYTYPPEADRYSGGMVLNSSTTVIDNLVLTRLAARFYKAHPADAARGLIRSARLNFRNYWRPSATYTANALIAELPWRKAYMKATGGVVLPIVLLLAALSYAFRRRPDPRETAGRLVPVLFIFATSMFCNRYGWTEALRFKFFLEPLYWLFIFAEAHALFWGLRHYGIHLREET
jgi:hypothetical protein